MDVNIYDGTEFAARLYLFTSHVFRSHRPSQQLGAIFKVAFLDFDVVFSVSSTV